MRARVVLRRDRYGTDVLFADSILKGTRVALSRSNSIAVLVAALAIGVVGCGSSPSATNSTASPSTPLPQAPLRRRLNPVNPRPSLLPEAERRTAPPASTSGDNSIQTFGSAANGAEKRAISGSAFAFFHALATADYSKVCADLSATDRRGLLRSVNFGHPKVSGCSMLLARLHFGGTAESRSAAAGTLSAVRVNGDDAFVLFHPRDGKSRYYVMKREGGVWRPGSLVPGDPLNP